ASLLALAACGDDGTSAVGDTADATADAADAADTDGPADTAPDTLDAAGDSADTAADTAEPDPRVRHSRAIGGMSMGAVAITIALEHPGTFDMVGALGGYADASYLMSHMLRLELGGFCPLATLEAELAALNDPTAPVWCGPATPKLELEFAQDWNHLHYDSNGITMTREFYREVIENFSIAFGNLTVPGDATRPVLPAGVDVAWYEGTAPADRCADPKPVDHEHSFNLEYNPDGAYAVLPLCDQDGPTAAGLAPSDFDAAAPRNRPISPLLFVDLNGDGRRDYAEPVMVNAWERFDDVGVDGCPNALEDGAGGCHAATAIPPLAPDPNGDDYDWAQNPDGTEGNDAYDLGEPYRDDGLDGVPAARAGFADEGEGNGHWDAVANFASLMARDADSLIRAASDEDLAGTDFWLDAGIRDALQAGVGTRNIVAALRSRGRDVRVYHGFGGREGTLTPAVGDGEFTANLFSADLSAGAIGRDVYVEYGDPDATPAQIAEGDGKHVGRDIDALNRLAAFLFAALARMPDPDRTPGFDPQAARDVSYYSEALGARRGFTIGLPPGYDDPANAALRYPVLFFLHGLGQEASDLGPAAAVLSILMSDGRMPKAILVFPDGQCCFVDQETGQRECACVEGQGVRHCVDPACTGSEASCAVRDIPNARLVRECQKGSLYTDLLTDRWGVPRSDLGYATSVMEIVGYVDANYRTRAGEAPSR
ncbi:MAG: hypothetical protein KC635_28490, partial [Myxococcales bacterium]|nr:hypothetical protein [Myxococcales bacterium]